MAYETLAASYDRLTNDVPYEKILAFYEALLQRYGLRPETALDLACGTGSMAILLAKKGLSVVAADMSEEMLTEAAAKAAGMENPPWFIRQRMEKLRLPAPVDLAVCCLDGVNYVTEPAALQEAFRRVFAALTPGGLFIFDINSERKLRGLDGQIWLDEDEDVYCLWRTDYDEAKRLCRYGMDIFTRRGKLWERSAEEHLEYAYRPEELVSWLGAAGFTAVETFADRRMEPPSEDEQRIFIAAQKPKNHF